MVTMIDFAAKETGLPVIQFGHSLGGLIGLYTALHSSRRFALRSLQARGSSWSVRRRRLRSRPLGR